MAATPSRKNRGLTFKESSTSVQPKGHDELPKAWTQCLRYLACPETEMKFHLLSAAELFAEGLTMRLK